MLHLPDPPLFPKAVASARSTLIPQGCCLCQIHPYFLWLLPPLDPPLFLMAVTLLDRPLFSMAVTPARPPLFLMAVTTARSTLISYGCYPCYNHGQSLGTVVQFERFLTHLKLYLGSTSTVRPYPLPPPHRQY